jgi:hypothetical protein
MSSGPSSPTSQTVTQTTIPEYLRPQVEEMIGQASGLMQGELSRGFQPFEGQRVAGFSPLQAQAFENIAGQQTSPQLTDASNMAYGAGSSALGFGQQGGQFGQMGAQFGQQGAGYGALGADIGMQGVGIGALGMQQAGQVAGQAGSSAANYGGQAVATTPQAFGAGQAYQQQATSPSEMQSWMSPYMQNVVDVQQREARRAADIQRQSNQAAAVGQGAFGGSRSALVEAELQRNLGTQLGDIQARGLQSSFEDARKAQQFGADVGLRGLQTGYQGIQTGLQGVGQQIAAGQLGLAGAETGLRGIGMGIQGAQTGIEGARTGISGAQTGISGAQTGIQGAQAATGAAGQLGSLGAQQFQQQMGITDAMQKYGAVQQAQRQEGLNADYQDYLSAQNFPYQQLGFFSDIIRGLPMSQNTQSVYGGQPSAAAQIPGALAALYAGSKMKEGGRVQKYQSGGVTAAPEAMTLQDARSLPTKLRRLSDTQLAAYARNVKDAVALSAIQTELQRREKSRMPYSQPPEQTTAQGIAKQAEAASIGMAGGGIVALQAGGNPLGRRGPMGVNLEEVLRRTPSEAEPMASPTVESLGRANVLQPGAVGRYAQDVPSQVETIGAQGMEPPPQGMPDANYQEPLPDAPPQDPTQDATQAQPQTPRQSDRIGIMPQTGRDVGAAASPGQIPTTWDAYRQMASEVQVRPEDQAILDDMRSRLEGKFSRAETQSDKSKYEAIFMAGLAMMGGNSLADGIARAAQAGGATYMASSKEARKAMDAAEDAELAFNKYQMEYRKGNRDSAEKSLNNFMDNILKLKQIDATNARTAAISGGASDAAKIEPQVRLLTSAINDLPGKIMRDPRFKMISAYQDQIKNMGKLSANDQNQYNALMAEFNVALERERAPLESRRDALMSRVSGETDDSGFTVRPKQ